MNKKLAVSLVVAVVLLVALSAAVILLSQPNSTAHPVPTVKPVGTLFTTPVSQIASGDSTITQITGNADMTTVGKTKVAVVIYICNDIREACQLDDPIVAQLAQHYGGKVKFFYLDPAKASDIAAQLGVQSRLDIPLFIILQNGSDQNPRQVTGYFGADELTQIIDSVLKAPTATAAPSAAATQAGTAQAAAASPTPVATGVTGKVNALTNSNSSLLQQINTPTLIYVCGDQSNPVCVNENGVITWLAARYSAKVTVYKVDADTSSSLAVSMGIQSPAQLPVYIIVDGTDQFIVSGSRTQIELSQALDAMIALQSGNAANATPTPNSSATATPGATTSDTAGSGTASATAQTTGKTRDGGTPGATTTTPQPTS